MENSPNNVPPGEVSQEGDQNTRIQADPSSEAGPSGVNRADEETPISPTSPAPASGHTSDNETNDEDDSDGADGAPPKPSNRRRLRLLKKHSSGPSRPRRGEHTIPSLVSYANALQVLSIPTTSRRNIRKIPWARNLGLMLAYGTHILTWPESMMLNGSKSGRIRLTFSSYLCVYFLSPASRSRPLPGSSLLLDCDELRHQNLGEGPERLCRDVRKPPLPVHRDTTCCRKW